MSELKVRDAEKEDMIHWCLDTIADAGLEDRCTTSYLRMELLEDAPFNLTPDVWTQNAIGHLLGRNCKETIAKIKGNSLNGGEDFYCRITDVDAFLEQEKEEAIRRENGPDKKAVDQTIAFLKKVGKAPLKEIYQNLKGVEISPQTLKSRLLEDERLDYNRKEGSCRTYFSLLKIR